MNFPDTRWTLIAQLGDEQKVGTALDQLCEAYWQPIYAYLVQAGRSHPQAQDLTQEFLHMAVRQRLLEQANPVGGKLRSWLLASLRNFLANAHRHDSRQKRGAGQPNLSLDEDALAEIGQLAASPLSPDEAFDRAWVSVLLRRAVHLLTQQYQMVGKLDEFTALLPWLLDDGHPPQSEAASKAGMTIAKFRVQLHRLRGRYREVLRREIIVTLEREEDYEEELAYLFRLVGQSG